MATNRWITASLSIYLALIYKTNAPASQIEILMTAGGGVYTAFVHRGRQN